MRSSLALAGILFFSYCTSSVASPAHSPAPATQQAPNATPAPPQAPAPAPATPATPAKPKKLWTNENLSDANGPISVVGDPKHPAKGKTGQPADPQYVANTRKQLEKLQSELDDTDKQLAALKNFASGEPSPSAGKQLNKGYNLTPVDQQIQSLEEKKKETQSKIDALLDEARKKGVEPGQLR